MKYRQDDHRYKAHLHGPVADSGGLGNVALARVMAAVAQFIWITITDFRLWGCPHCGFIVGINAYFANDEIRSDCGECGNGYVVVNDRVKRSSHNWGTDANPLYPKVRRWHPRHGTPCHGSPDDSHYIPSPRGFRLVADGRSDLADNPLELALGDSGGGIVVCDVYGGPAAEDADEPLETDDEQEQIKNAMMAMPVDGLDVPRACYQPLINHPIVSIGDLQGWSVSRLETLPGLGEKRAQRIAEAMEAIGLPLSEI